MFNNETVHYPGLSEPLLERKNEQIDKEINLQFGDDGTNDPLSPVFTHNDLHEAIRSWKEKKRECIDKDSVASAANTELNIIKKRIEEIAVSIGEKKTFDTEAQVEVTYEEKDEYYLLMDGTQTGTPKYLDQVRAILEQTGNADIIVTVPSRVEIGKRDFDKTWKTYIEPLLAERKKEIKYIKNDPETLRIAAEALTLVKYETELKHLISNFDDFLRSVNINDVTDYIFIPYNTDEELADMQAGNLVHRREWNDVKIKDKEKIKK